MADIKVTRAHAHGKEGARERCARMLDKMKDGVGLKLTWDGDTCRFTGPAEGTLVVNDESVDVEVKLGFAAKIMKGKIEQRLNEGLDKALG